MRRHGVERRERLERRRLRYVFYSKVILSDSSRIRFLIDPASSGIPREASTKMSQLHSIESAQSASMTLKKAASWRRELRA